MKKLFLLVFFVSLFVVSVFAADEKKIEIKDIPKSVMSLVQEKVKNFKAEEATLKGEEGDLREYSIKGSDGEKSLIVVVKLDERSDITGVSVKTSEKAVKKQEGEANK